MSETNTSGEGLKTPVVPDHEMIRIIGSGSSGRVWLARNALGAYRAVKVVTIDTFRHRRSFEQEFQGILKFEPISRLNDGLVDILQVGFSADKSYFYCVMELADDVWAGQTFNAEAYQPRTLDAERRRFKRLPVKECVRIGTSIASALIFLHKNGLTHRDIKPSNIIFVNGQPKLADIGLVTDVSNAKSNVGTEGFFPPEGSGSARADIYALGKVLYEIGTGNDRSAYPELPADLGKQAEQVDFVQLNKIILKACRKRPWERYQTAGDMLLALLNFESHTNLSRKCIGIQITTKIAGVAGLIVFIAVVVAVVWRLLISNQ